MINTGLLRGGFWYPCFTVSQRKIWRHESGYGSVLEYRDNDRVKKRVLVLDAQYRTATRFGQSDKNTVLPDYSYNNDLGNPCISGSILEMNIKQLSDKKLNSVYSSDNWDRNTSKYNCDVWMKYQGVYDNFEADRGNAMTGVPAVEHCRSITVPLTPDNSVACDLPNINILCRLYIERDYIDSLDPTADGVYSKYALGYKNPRGAFRFWFPEDDEHDYGTQGQWSSTETTAYSTGNFNIIVQVQGLTIYGNRNTFYYGVIPVVELD